MKWSFRLLIPVMFMLSLPEGTLAADSPEVEAAYQKARAAYHLFRNDASRMKYRHHWQKISRMFEQMAEAYPKSTRAPDALFTAGRLNHELYRFSGQREDLERSERLLRRVVKEFPDHRLADDAQLLIALRWVEFDKDPQQARRELAFLTDRFPEGDVTPKARRMIEDLGGPAADPEPEVEVEVEEAEGKEAGTVTSTGKGKEPLDSAARSKTSAEVEEKTVFEKPAPIPVLEEIRHWSNPDYTRISLYTRTRPDYRTGLLPLDAASKQPARLYVDLKDTVLGVDVGGTVDVGDGVVKRIRVAAREGGIVRVVVDLDQERGHRVFPMDDPARVVVDVGEGPPQAKREEPSRTKAEEPHVPDLGRDAGIAAAEERIVAKENQGGPDGGPADGAAHEEPAEKEKARLEGLKGRPGVSLSMLAGLKVKRVVLDPGHGGGDPGAIGSSGTLEKDLTLDLAKRVASLLGNKLKLKVDLTRNSDRTLALEERTAIANTSNADLFLSIHLNAHRDRRLRGVETFYLNITDDRYSMRLAARENATSEKSISDLQFILADLALKSHVDDSISLSEHIQKAVVGTLNRHYKTVRDLGVKHALFYVLIGARMPSILVEASFLSNPEEEKRLKSVAYRQHLAEAIFTGIKNFIAERDRVLGADE